MLDSIKDAIFYHIYPLGFCGTINEKGCCTVTNSFEKINDKWISHFKTLGINAIYFGPIFESTYHGYDTIDYSKIDSRLGSNDDFKNLVYKLHDNDIKVVVDGVFNHVGREFWAFKDIKEKGSNSPYVSWFNIDFNRNSNYNDGFYYEGWEGHYDLVKLNLSNREVRNYLFNIVKKWVEDFKIDGIRLDVAYSLPKDFLMELRSECRKIKSNLWLMGEMIHGDYNTIAGENLLHCATNYEAYKGLYSSHNDKNYFEIAYTLNREFGDCGIYKNLGLYNFVDNHDVNRIATMVKDKRYLNNIYTILFTMPGIPSIYYGSEWGIEGDRKVTDLNLRPQLNIDDFLNNKDALNLQDRISKFISIRKENKILWYGNYKEICVRNRQFIFGRCFENKWIFVALNLDDNDVEIDCTMPFNEGKVSDILNNNENIQIVNSYMKIKIPAFSSRIFKSI